MNAGGRIAQERIEQGLTQQQLADLVKARGGEISQTGIDKIEKRDSKRPRYIREIALALNVTEEWLIHGKLPKYRNMESDVRLIMAQIKELPEQDQSMIMASLKAQIDVARKRGATLSSVQGKK